MSEIKMKNEKGFSLVETMVTMALFFVVLGSVYSMVIHYGNVSRTENSRIRMQQESRYMMTNFTQEIQDAGAVLTAMGLERPIIFNGVYPLNQTDYPDGFIVASGDPDGVTRLAEDYSFADDSYYLTVDTVIKTTSAGYNPAKEYEFRAWKPGDKAILVNQNGYLIFKVKTVTYNTNDTDIIEMREQPVYYSGLLYTQSSRSAGARLYTDTLGSGVKGNDVTYPAKSAVIRLTSFAIYLFQDITYPSVSGERLIHQMIRVTDAMGEADVLLGTSTAEKSIISENIFDLQISYKAYETNEVFKESTPTTTTDLNFYYFGGTGTSSDAGALMTNFRNLLVKQVDIAVVNLTDEFGSEIELNHSVPAIGDESAYTLPYGRYGYQLYSQSIDLWNYNVM